MSTRFLVRQFVLGVVSALFLTTSGFAAVDMFLEIPGIPGESRLKPGAIDVTGYAYDVKSPRSDKNDIFTIGQSVAEAILPDPTSLKVEKSEPSTVDETTATETLTTAIQSLSPATTTPTVTTAPVEAVAPAPAVTSAAESTPAPAAESTTVTDSVTTTP